MLVLLTLSLVFFCIFCLFATALRWITIYILKKQLKYYNSRLNNGWRRMSKRLLTSQRFKVIGLMLYSLTRPRSLYMCSSRLNICTFASDQDRVNVFQYTKHRHSCTRPLICASVHSTSTHLYKTINMCSSTLNIDTFVQDH